MCVIDQWVNQVIEGDCLEIMKGFPPASIDMVLADLPYGITHNKWDVTIDLNTLWEQYKRIIKPSGVVVLTGYGLFTAKLILSNPEMFRYKIVWIKSVPTNFLNAAQQPLRRHEDICVFYEGKPVYHPQMGKGKPYGRISNQTSSNYNTFKSTVKSNPTGRRYPYDVVFYEEEQEEDYVYFKVARSEGSIFHATQKPVALGKYLIRTYSNEGDIILDNTCGSGSFLVAAIEEGRRFIGIEKNGDAHNGKMTGSDLIKRCRDRIATALKGGYQLSLFSSKEK